MTHKEAIRHHLRIYGSITSYEAIQKYGCTRLSAIIFQLRKEGMAIGRSDIVRRKTQNGKNVNVVFGKYYLEDENEI